MSVTTRRKLTSQEKRMEMDFDNRNYANLQRASAYNYEEVPAHKSYLEVNSIVADESRKNVFMRRNVNPAVDYEYVTPVEAAATTSDELDALRLKPEAMPSEETMKILLTNKASEEEYERMLSGGLTRKQSRQDEVVFIDESYEEEQSERQAYISLNTRGKVTVAAYVAVILTMLIIALVTASSIASLSAVESSLQDELYSVNLSIAALSAEAEVLSDPAVVGAKAATQGMFTPSEGNGITTISAPAFKAESEYIVPSNWFDSVCKFFANLFGR